MGIFLPAAGARAEAGTAARTDQADLVVATLAVGGVELWDPPTPVVQVLPVGSFGESTTLTFSLPKAGEVTGMSFGFTPAMQIEEGETVTLQLPGFLGAPNASSDVESTLGKVASATWTLSDTTVVLTVNATIAPNETVLVHIPSAMGVGLPLDGIRWQQLSIAVSCSAVDGPISADPRTPIVYTQPVGAFGSSHTIAFSPAKAGSPTRITLNFQAKMKLFPGETVTFVLPSILGSSAELCIGPPPGHTAAFATGNWTLSGSTLALTVHQEVAADESVAVLIPSSAGLALPASGLPRDWANFSVFSDALEGPVIAYPPTPLFASQPVGVLNDTLLVLEPGCPSSPASFNLSFLPSMAIDAGSVLTLAVPAGLNSRVFNCSEEDVDVDGFTRCVGDWTCGIPSLCNGTTVPVSSTPPGFVTQVRWLPGLASSSEYSFWNGSEVVARNASELWGAKSLLFDVASSVGALTPVTISLQASASLELPRGVLETDRFGITLACDAASGPVPATAVTTTLGHASLFARRPRAALSMLDAGLTTALAFDVLLATDLPGHAPVDWPARNGATSRLEFFLPGFKYASTAACPAGICPVDVLGPSAAKFMHTPEHPCASFSPVQYVGCGWSASYAGLTDASVCYRVTCPAGCPSEGGEDVYRTCAGSPPTYLDHVRAAGGGASLVQSSICASARAANAVRLAGGDIVVTVHGNVTAPVCDAAGAPAPREVAVAAAGGEAQWLRFYAPVDARAGEWDVARHTLIVTLRQDEGADAGEVLAFSVANFSSKQGISGASAGLTTRLVVDDTCQADSTRGVSVEPIGSMRTTSEISFAPLAAGLPAAITVRFTPEMPIAANENIIVRLNK